MNSIIKKKIEVGKTDGSAVILKATGISQQFKEAKNPIFSELDISVQKETKVALVGRSGSGKTTLLHILSGLQKPSAGKVMIDDIALERLSNQELAKLRNQKIGFVYQSYSLLKDFTAIENIALVAAIAGESRKECHRKARACMKALGISHLAEKMPQSLSGGEKQRVAIARAIINKPAILFADEPTGNLDQESAGVIIQALDELHKTHKMSIIMATHDLKIANQFDTILNVE